VVTGEKDGWDVRGSLVGNVEKWNVSRRRAVPCASQKYTIDQKRGCTYVVVRARCEVTHVYTNGRVSVQPQNFHNFDRARSISLL